MNINHEKKKNIKVVSAAVLASVIALGGVGTVPAAHAETAVSQADSAGAFAYLNDAGRTKLINLQEAYIISSLPSQTTSFDHVAVYELLAIQNEAYSAVMDPATSQAHLQAIARKYEQKLKAYQELVLDKVWVDSHFYKTKSAFLRQANYDESQYTPEAKRILGAIAAAEAALGKNPTDKDYRDVFVKYYLPVELNEFDLQTSYDKSPYQSIAERYRKSAQAAVAEATAADSTKDYSAYTAAIEQSISNFEQLLASSANQKLVDFTAADIQSKYEDLLAEVGLHVPSWGLSEQNLLINFIARSKELLSYPTGNQPGQYSASAASKLRLALQNAEKDLSKAKTRVDYGLAAAKLYESMSKFYASKN